MAKLISYSILLLSFIALFPSFAFVSDFEKMTPSDQKKTFLFVAKELSSNDINKIKKAAYPYELAEIKDETNTSLVHYAVDKNMVDTLNLLEKNGVPIDTQTNTGVTPLQVAIFNENLPLVKFLVKKNADINLKNNNGQSPLMVATLINNREIIDFLLEEGAKINLKNNNGFNVLTLAIVNHNHDLIGLYIKKGVDINARASFGRTPLHFAVQANDYDAAKMLLEAGAKVNMRDEDIQNPNTPLDILIRQESPISISNSSSKIEELLTSYGAKQAKPYYQDNFSLSALYIFGVPFNEQALGNKLKTPIQVQYTGFNLRYYVTPDMSFSWSYAYGFSLDHKDKTMIMAPGSLIGLQSLYSFFQTKYNSELHGPAKGFYYTLLGLSAFLPEGISWDIHLPTVPFMSFSIELDWAKAHYIIAKQEELKLSINGEIQGRLNLMLDEHFIMGMNVNIGISYSQLSFVWGLGLTLGALF